MLHNFHQLLAKVVPLLFGAAQEQLVYQISLKTAAIAVDEVYEVCRPKNLNKELSCAEEQLHDNSVGSACNYIKHSNS